MKKLLAFLLCCLLMTACAEQTTDSSQPVVTSIPTTAETEYKETTACTEPQIPLNIFVPNENADDFNTIPTIIEERDADKIIDLLIQYGTLKENVKLNSIELKDSQLNLDFNQEFLNQLSSYGSAGELMMIGSVVNTFLSVYEADSVYITVNAEIIESGHVIYDFPMKYFE